MGNKNESKSSEKVQREIINFYMGGLEANKIKTGDPKGRFGLNLRIQTAGDPNAMLNKVLPCKLEASEVVRSGQFATWLLTITKDIVNAKKGDSCYFVQSVRSSGEIRNKALTPDALGMAGKEIGKANFIKEAIKGITATDDVNDNVKKFLEELLEASKGNNGKISGTQITSISDSDINVIAKDFGEISGAVWYMFNENKKATGIEFPSASNAKLVDYYAIEGKKKIAISAKANEGAPPSIESIAELLKKKHFSIPLRENARKAIISISDQSVVEGIVSASRDLKTKGYAWMKAKVFKKDWKAADVEAALAKYKSPDAFTKDFAPFFAVIGRAASEKSIKEVFQQKAKRWGLVISPMGYSLVDEMNENQNYIGVLTDTAQEIKVSQLYIKINKTLKQVEYKIKEFGNSKFEFKYNANAKTPGLKKISFVIAK